MKIFSIEVDSVRPIWLGIAMLVALIFNCCVKKRFPTVKELVELVALTAGLCLAIPMLIYCTTAKGEFEPWGLLAGGATIGLISVKGIWDIFTKKDEEPKIVEPKQDP